MNKIYFKIINISEVIVLTITILVAPILMGIGTNYHDSIIYGHYITLVPNIIFIIFSYKQYSKVNSCYHLIVTRVGATRVRIISFLFATCLVLLYSVILYGYLSFFLIFPADKVIQNALIWFMVINTACYIIEEVLMMLQLGEKKSIIYVFSPILLNILFHYYLIPTYFTY